MIVSEYSIVMVMAFFTIAVAAGSWLIFSRCRQYAGVLIGFVFCLGFARLLLPVEFDGHILIRDWYVYPWIQRVWQWEPLPGLNC